MSSAPRSDVLTENSTPHEIALFKCRLAENSERFDDMAKFIKELCDTCEPPLGASERNYLSVAFKNAVGSRRSGLRCLGAMKAKYESKEGAQKNVQIITEFYNQVLKELEDICNDVINLIKNVIMTEKVLQGLPKGQQTSEFKVFFWKMMADYYRYISEFTSGEQRKEVIKLASHYYQLAADYASGPDGLNYMHPIRLGLNLNYSVFLFEIEDRPEIAQEIARKAFDDAVGQLDKSSQDSEHKDSTLIMQLLRDNLTLWSAAADEQVAQPPPAAVAQSPAPPAADQPAAPEGGAAAPPPAAADAAPAAAERKE